MQITWATPPTASAMHAAIAVADGLAMVDERLAAALAAPLDALQDDAPWGDRSRRDWLVAQAGHLLTDPPPPSLAPIVEAFDSWRRSHSGGDLVEELTLRRRPLSEQWDARGPGLLRALERLTEPGMLPAEAKVALVSPVLGGHGVAIPVGDAVLFEAVLANPHPRLPEVVRLGWLLAQLGGDAPLALLPAVLAAAEEVELATADAATLAEAAGAWRLRHVPAEAVWDWWGAYRDAPVPWRVANANLPV